MKLPLLLFAVLFSITAHAQRVDSVSNPYKLALLDGYKPLQHQKNANIVLGSWSVLSMGAGAYQLFSPNPFIKAMGMQNLIWGAVDGGIALYGSYHLSNTDWSSKNLQLEREKFRKILLINTLLDVGYLALGFGLSRAANAKWHGHGYGILIQGGFLLMFDGINYALTF
ncbi:MAG: hypothetical protein Q8J69_12415 [Sphingobacteriaceae bacterium]|nr:hypothetical protein [Sphingobacteriaceae bacterium]